jgi:ribose transport system ATP-binding protein
VLSGVFPPDNGTILLDKKKYCPTSPLEARKRGIAMIYQELSLAPHLSIEDNISLGDEPTSWGLVRRQTMRKTAKDALKLMGHFEIDPRRRVDTLSVGMQQIVEIARAMAFGCKVLVFDEPTSSLSQEDVKRLFTLIRHLRSSAHSIIYISHFIEEVKEIADRFTVLRDGKSVASGNIRDVSKEQIATLMVGRDISELYPHSTHTSSDVLLELDGLNGIEKPKNANFTLRRGEVVGIAGLVGSGRTEFARTIFGLDPIASGNIRVGTLKGTATPQSRWRQGVGMVSENRKSEGLAISLTVADNITLPNLTKYGRFGFVSPKAMNQASSEWIRRLEIKTRTPVQQVIDLSGGNQQKVAIARLLESDVDLLLLDEPTRGIDVASKAMIYDIIDKLVLKNKAILFISSYLPELFGVCDRIAVMCRGRLGQACPVSELSEHDVMLAATGASI